MRVYIFTFETVHILFFQEGEIFDVNDGPSLPCLGAEGGVSSLYILYRL